MNPNVIGALIYVYIVVGIIIGGLSYSEKTSELRALAIGSIWPIVLVAVLIKEMYHMAKEYLERF